MNPTHLLDTMTLIWAVESPNRLSEVAHSICSDTETRPAVSVVSLMELIVKVRTGRLVLSPDPTAWWDHHVGRLGYQTLALRQQHVEELWTLPLIHRDPADRLLICQAICEGIPLVTSDEAIRHYPVAISW